MNKDSDVFNLNNGQLTVSIGTREAGDMSLGHLLIHLSFCKLWHRDLNIFSFMFKTSWTVEYLPIIFGRPNFGPYSVSQLLLRWSFLCGKWWNYLFNIFSGKYIAKIKDFTRFFWKFYSFYERKIRPRFLIFQFCTYQVDTELSVALIERVKVSFDGDGILFSKIQFLKK